ncbi:MAG: PKD domain-containing protein [Bacteroidetes bacterium]|nr:PKD domain-containing protein [Bacteroidota bacterium]
MIHLYKNNRSVGNVFLLRQLLIGIFICTLQSTASAQCPVNIDFEMGDFTNWQCWVGTHYETISGVKDTIDLGTTPVAPVNGRHTIISPSPALDQYGQFPVSCPNGSGFSVKLGSNAEGSGLNKAEGLSYTFTIPAGQNKFSLTYYYAVVLHLPTSHNIPSQLPKFVISLENLTDGGNLPCPLDPFTPSGLPGFHNAPGDIQFKPWAAASIKLDGYAGKTIRISFKTANCTLGGHFGYAYIDLGSQCSSSFDGAVFCPDDASVTVTAPPGYATYNWYNGLMTQILGNAQTLTLTPPPLSGDSLKVELIPFNGYGCTDTLTAYLWDTLTVHANAGPSQHTCDNNPVQIGMAPEPNRIYKWTPPTGLSDPNIANPTASPSGTTLYTLTVTNSGGGCATISEVTVAVDTLSDSIRLIGAASYCKGSGQFSQLQVLPHDSIQWFKDGFPIPGAVGHQTLLNVTQTGAYYAMVFSYSGCNRTTAVKQIDIWDQAVADFTTATPVQCALNNSFFFKNNSTLASGTMQYNWDLGDGNTATTADVTHSYTKAGTYHVVLNVIAPGGCNDTKSFDVVVNPSPVADYSVDIPEQCFANNWYVFTNKSSIEQGVMTYKWDFGDGNYNNSNDVAHSFAVAGTYPVTLTATETNGGCNASVTYPIVVHQSPVSNFSVNSNPQCFPGHQFVLTNGTSITSDALTYAWDMGDGSAIITTPDVTYSYAKAGDYTINMVASTASGCKDSTQFKVTVYPVPFPDFTVRDVCENIDVPVINRTINNTTSTVNYLWDFGNGHTDFVKTPHYAYPAAGIYPVTLKVSTAQCPNNFSSKTLLVNIEAAIPGITYPSKDAAFNYPEQLDARQIGSSVTWSPATSLNNRFSFSPLFTGIAPQLYTIQIKTNAGCITTDTLLVKTHKKIEVYVPNSFTPDANGYNDRLRPVLIGFTKVNYFRIYNRWGQMLYSQNSDQPGWDGTINGKPAEVQTVVWMIEAVDVDGVVHKKQGTTVLFR